MAHARIELARMRNIGTRSLRAHACGTSVSSCLSMACRPKTPSRSVQNDVGVWKSRMISFDMIAYFTQAVPSRAACHPTRESIITGTFLKDH